MDNEIYISQVMIINFKRRTDIYNSNVGQVPTKLGAQEIVCPEAAAANSDNSVVFAFTATLHCRGEMKGNITNVIFSNIEIIAVLQNATA